MMMEPSTDPLGPEKVRVQQERELKRVPKSHPYAKVILL